MQVLIAISGFCGFCSRIGNTPCTTPFDFLFVISIHVPAWGTTIASIPDIASFPFQPTFPRGERPTPLTEVTRATLNFNPRSRVGNDMVFFQDCVDIRISIHVPAWGTTVNGPIKGDSYVISIHVPAWGTTFFTERSTRFHAFQSTFPRGERPLSLSCVTSTSLFQSTFPRGERPVCHYRLYLCCNFNPRSHVGNDWTGADLYRYIIISIHVPTWGTT